jgi:hypothetical protein
LYHRIPCRKERSRKAGSAGLSCWKDFAAFGPIGHHQMRYVLLFTIGTAATMAQPVSFGIKAGVPLSDLVNATSVFAGPGGFSNNTSMTSPYIAGPTVEVRLPLGLAIEVDALYRHLNYTSDFDTCILCGSLAGSEGMTKTTAGDWEFPLVMKYRFHTKRVRPYVDIGVAEEILTNLAETGFTRSFNIYGVGPPMSAATSAPAERAVTGFVTGAGVDVHFLFLHLSPEIRYTRWGAQQFVSLGLSSNQNQVEFLLGITF